jgi:anti-sigma regulatory factor (Ser/Thr protein kinase)
VIERLSFPNSPDVVGQARRRVTESLRNVPDDLVEMVGLMVSELATNCVRHTTTDFTLELEQTADHIRVGVTDRGSGEPIVRSPEPSDPSGRGLQIVQELADEFGVDYRPLEGAAREKTVWFVVRLDRGPRRPAASGRGAGLPHAEPVRAETSGPEPGIHGAPGSPGPAQLRGSHPFELSCRGRRLRRPAPGYVSAGFVFRCRYRRGAEHGIGPQDVVGRDARNRFVPQ